MIEYNLPTTILIDNIEQKIRSDYRAILDIITVLNDVELDKASQAYIAFQIFYEDWESIKDVQAAIDAMFLFIDCNQTEKPTKKQPRLVDWEKDFQPIISAINRIAKTETRALDYLHWWTFTGYYHEIGECPFSMVVALRDKIKRKKKLEKWEKEFYDANRDRVDLKAKVDTETQAEIDDILGGE